MEQPAENKPFSLPYKMLGWIAFAKSVLQVFTMIAIARLVNRSSNQNIPLIFFYEWLLVLVIVVEAVVYWMIRKKNYNHQWASLHVFSWLILMIVLPFSAVIIPFILNRRYYNTERYHELMGIVSTIRFYTFWILLLVGHAFFTMLLIKLKKAGSNSTGEESDATGDQY